MRKVAVFLILCALTESAVARKEPVPKLMPGGSAIGIEINVRTPAGMATGTPDAVVFVRIDREHGVMQDKVLPATYVSGSRAYLLNVVPGDYAAIACSNREAGGKVPLLGPLLDYSTRSTGQDPVVVTFFSGALVEATRVSVGAGEFVFAGSFRVRQGKMTDADPVAKHYADMNSRRNRRIGEAEESKRDDEARRAFLAKAKEDLAEGGWADLMAAERRPSVPQSPVALARDLADRGENGTFIVAELTMKSKALQEWLAGHPDDVDALIVAARLHWLDKASSPVAFAIVGGKKPPDPALAYEPAHKYLDHALDLQPKNAEALYWKGRLYGVIAFYLEEPNAGYHPIDQAKSIVFARKAVELAPAETRYSVALAQYLNGHQESKEALKVLEALPDGRRHPLYSLLSDFEAFPLPEKAVFEPMMTQTLTQLQTERGELPNFRHERIRAYVMPGSVKEVAPFMTQHWPDFELGKPETNEEKIDIYNAGYRLTDGKWVRQRRLPKSQQGLMLTMLMDVPRIDADAIKRLNLPPAEHYVMIALADFRQ